MLTDEQLLRYQRQVFLDEIDILGQERLLAAKIVVVGAGGLGNAVLPQLVGAGVGEITIWDGDQVDLSNLHRQTLFRVTDVGQNKAQVAKSTLESLNPDCSLHVKDHMLTDAESLKGYDLILDCTDNLAARDLVNQFAVKNQTPLVSGAAIGLQGQVALYNLAQAEQPCWRCVFPDIDDKQLNCRESGVMGPVVQLVGAMQAQIALLFLTGNHVATQLHLLDGKRLKWRAINVGQNPDCPVHSQWPAQ